MLVLAAGAAAALVSLLVVVGALGVRVVGAKLRELSTDSLSFIEFLVRVEETFNIEFEAEELDINVWETVGDIIKAVGVKTNETGFKGAESV